LAIAAPRAGASDAPSAPIGTVAPKTCGEGVCKRTVTGPVCTPGKPITDNGGWLAKADPATQSWDADCNGTVEKESFDLSQYKVGCEMERGTCVTKRRGLECGEKQDLWAKCELATKADGSKYCHTGALLGALVQRCR
jgi:hypothetical protein